MQVSFKKVGSKFGPKSKKCRNSKSWSHKITKLDLLLPAAKEVQTSELQRIMSISFSASIIHQCDLIVETTHRQVEDVKQLLQSFEVNQQRLVDENATLQDDVTKLRHENEHLEKQLWDAKIRIRELCDNEDDRSQGGWTFTTPPKETDKVHHQERNVTRTPCSGAKSVAITNAESDFIEVFDEEVFPQQDSQETLFETQQVLVVEPKENFLDDSTGNIGLMLAMEAQDGPRIESAEDSMSLSSATTAASSSATSLSSCLMYSTPTKTPTKKRRGRSVNKWYNSTPKKWRRMLRTHRLQSIFLVGN